MNRNVGKGAAITCGVFSILILVFTMVSGLMAFMNPYTIFFGGFITGIVSIILNFILWLTVIIMSFNTPKVHGFAFPILMASIYGLIKSIFDLVQNLTMFQLLTMIITAVLILLSLLLLIFAIVLAAKVKPFRPYTLSVKENASNKPQQYQPLRVNETYLETNKVVPEPKENHSIFANVDTLVKAKTLLDQKVITSEEFAFIKSKCIIK